MWKPIVRCAIVGGIIVFLWSMISWMVLPLHKASMNAFSNEERVEGEILDAAKEDGIYVIPFMNYDEDQSQRSKSGPFIFVNVKRGVNFQNMTQSMVIGIITQILAAGLITYLLLKTKAMKYWGRVWFVTVVGIVIALVSAMPAWNWWHFPGTWALLEAFDVVIGWFLGGLVIAKLVKN